MLSLSQIEQDLTAAMKAKDQLSVDVLRGLKSRVQNEKILKMRDISEEDILGLVRSEIKKRKEASESFKSGGRTELSDKELKEAEILGKYLPAQMGEADLIKILEAVIQEGSFTAQDFGKAMGAVKAKVGNAAEGGTLAKLLKEKLK
ncbi:MAG: GatB/YqeY domain-containing protein [Patescibacteria group bacterium]